MCFLCAISRWSRRVASILPWLVIPFIIVWALSQLLPPNYRLEITSSRLACLSVLLLSLVWYELLMPWLSSWRAHRSAVLRERKLIEALEAAKRRKEATRRCRNCLTAYKIQMPGSGKYVCTYCGHISKRPVLEVAGTLANSRSVMPGPVVSNDVAGMSHLRGVYQGNGPLTAWYRVAERNRCSWFEESSHMAENCSPAQYFPAFILKAWLFVWRKVSGMGNLTTDGCSDLDGMSENMDDASRSRLEKARRKADRKKQARLQKELLEAEDRRQREEVAKLVEERRRQRDELEILQQKERQTNTDKENETKKGDSEKRIDKGTRKVGKPDTNGRFDQVQESVPGPVQKVAKDVGDKLAVLAGSSKEQVNGFFTPSKSSRGTVQDHDPKYKTTMGSISRLGFLKRSGTTVQKASVSVSKTIVSLQSDGMLRSKKDSPHVGKSTMSSGSSSSSPRASAATHVTDSAWKRAPWISAWVKGSKGQAGDSDKAQTGAFSDNGKRLEPESDTKFNCSRNVSLIDKPSLSPVRGTAIQPPIAPPSVHADPLQQLFSTPSLFPPMDLCASVNFSAEQMLQNETKHVFLPEHTFFEAQNFSPVTDSYIPPFGSPSVQMVLDTKVSLSQPAVAGLGSSFTQPTVAPLCSLLSDTSYSGQPAYAPGSTVETPPFDVSHVSDIAATKDASMPLSLLSSLEVADLSSQTNKDNVLPWENPHEGALQLPPFSTVEALFETDLFTSDVDLLSPQKTGSLKVKEEVLEGVPGTEQSSLMSALDVRVWDDADGSQKLPAEFVDCITQEIMEDPVITADGHSYERSAIEKWLKHHDTSPKTGEVLPPPPGGSGVDKTLRPNHILRGQIIEYKEKLARMSELRSVTWPTSTRDTATLFNMTSSPSVLSF
ncbi:hypothetical protein GOP47_0018802 [Adiantum capillus-veneris]|uniref:U-box domain-containing protein n=1 Tax=Adiantum capillus-veneris TaxID=13818 RepID=A0A9D4UDV8_ADICA|nr:hypothetical protein GOP47_0018802 [Adiantum capillus-veneris]